MTLTQKIAQAKALVVETLTSATVLYCSFGKDSMVMLHLTRALGLDLPVVFNRIPHMSAKQAFANRIIEGWNLTVHSFPPIKVELVREPEVDIINYYSLGKDTMFMPVGVCSPIAGQPFLCGLRDLMQTPRGILVYPWDTVLIGHKSSDVDPLMGAVPLKQSVAQVTEGVKAVFPLRDFSDADVWAYTEQFSVPYNADRYDRANAYAEFSDRASNNDYYPTCTKCMDPAQPEQVECPKFGLVPNVSHLVPIASIKRLPYMEEVNAR